MKPLQRDELFENLQDFLKHRGVELKGSSYIQNIQRGCALLSDAINAGQVGFGRAKVEIDKKLDQLRQAIHEKTAPPPNRKARRKRSSGGGRAKPRNRD